MKNNLIYEVERMKHYETRLEDEIRSIANEIEFNKHTENLEEFRQELIKHRIKLQEHSKEVEKRTTTYNENFDQRITYENELKIIRNKIQQQEQRIRQQKQHKTHTIRIREDYQIQLFQCRCYRLKLELNLLEKNIICMKDEL